MESRYKCLFDMPQFDSNLLLCTPFLTGLGRLAIVSERNG